MVFAVSAIVSLSALFSVVMICTAGNSEFAQPRSKIFIVFGLFGLGPWRPLIKSGPTGGGGVNAQLIRCQSGVHSGVLRLHNTLRRTPEFLEDSFCPQSFSGAPTPRSPVGAKIVEA